MSAKPKLAVWKFSSCDGCQLSLLDLEDELLDIVGAVDVAYFVEASREIKPGPYDVSLVEGSITTPHEAQLIQEIRKETGFLISIGACATGGGIQSLKNFAAVEDYIKTVYATPEYISTLETATPISEHVEVDFELRGCPIDRYQLLEVIAALLHNRQPNIPTHSVCVECKRRFTPCVMVKGVPCLGPVTQAGCGAICPAHNRGCYGCFGPMETPNAKSLGDWLLSKGLVKEEDLVRMYRTFNADSPEFKEASLHYEGKGKS